MLYLDDSSIRADRLFGCGRNTNSKKQTSRKLVCQLGFSAGVGWWGRGNKVLSCYLLLQRDAGGDARSGKLTRCTATTENGKLRRAKFQLPTLSPLPTPPPPAVHLSYTQFSPQATPPRYEPTLLHFPGPLQCCSARLQRQNGEWFS
jgi:hypothetical protein